MFEGEKTRVFWIGLIMLALAFLGLFWMLWSLVNSDYWEVMVPQIVGFAVFFLVG